MSTASSSGSSTTCSTRCTSPELGIALAAPQIGVQKQVFVWDLDERPMVVFNPEIVESSGRVGVRRGVPVDPRPVRRDGAPQAGADARRRPRRQTIEIEADELEARLFQHELDHLHGVLMFDRMTPDQRKEALAEYRRLQEDAQHVGPPRKRRLRLT